jgi:hypothetical protein
MPLEEYLELCRANGWEPKIPSDSPNAARPRSIGPKRG